VQLTTDILMKGTGCTSAVAGVWLEALQKACDKHVISLNAKRVAAFLANVGVESNGLTALVENTNYSAARLAVVWPGRYSVNPFAVLKVPNDTAVRIGGNPVLVASNVYANRLGNGSEESRDGWNYRGQGLIQLTGKANIQAFFVAAGLPLTTDPAELQKPELASDSAAWFFANKGCFDFADQGNFDMTVCRINGQMPCPANQGNLRRDRYQDVLPLLIAAFAPSAPAKSSPTKAAKLAEQSTPATPSTPPQEKP
jgi:putative chitinase